MNNLLIALLTLFTYIQSAQNSIIWNENRKLEWKDFKGQPRSGGREGAATAARTAVVMNENGKGDVILTITTLFDSNISWVAKGNEIPYVLTHEQLHFDIQELHTRKLKKDLLIFNFSKQGLKTEIQNIIINNRKEKLAYQVLYDNVTGHAYFDIVSGPVFNEKGQNEWEDKIKSELASLENFKDPIVKIHGK